MRKTLISHTNIGTLRAYFFLIYFSIVTITYPMESQKQCILQFTDGKETALSLEIARTIPLFNDCLKTAQTYEPEITLPVHLQSSDWQLISSFLPTYDDFCQIEKSSQDTKDKNFDQNKNEMIMAKKDSQKQYNKKKKSKKIYELYTLTSSMNFQNLIQIFNAADYLGMIPLDQIVLVRITKLLEDKNNLETFIKDYQNFLHLNAQTNISDVICSLETGWKDKYYYVDQECAEDLFFDNVNYVMTAEDGSILKIGTKRKAKLSNLRPCIISYKKPKVKLCKIVSNSYNFLERIFLRGLKKEFQRKNLKRALLDQDDKFYWAWRKKCHNQQSINLLRLLAPTYRIRLCPKHNPELIKIYSSLGEKDPVVAKIAITMWCGKCLELRGWKKCPKKNESSVCLIEKKTESAHCNKITNMKQALIYSGLLFGYFLINKLQNRDIIDSSAPTWLSTLSSEYVFTKKDQVVEGLSFWDIMERTRKNFKIIDQNGL